MIKLKYYPYDLKFSEVFAVSSNARTSTEVIYVELECQGNTGYGEASFPPYMKEKRDDNLLYLSKLNFEAFNSPFQLHEIYHYLDNISEENTPAKAAIDIALHDLMGKVSGLPIYKLLGLESNKNIYTSFTIGIGEDDFILRQLNKAKEFKTIKVKLSGDTSYNKHAIEFIQSHSTQSIGVDFNGGLPNQDIAIAMINWLANKNISYIEQPLPVALEKDYIFLKAESPLDIYGDESIQNVKDIIYKRELFDGVNLKLMKCGGISKAYEQATVAQSLGLKTMLGCMAEGSCAVSAAANLASMFDRVDLDGHLMMANDLFEGVIIVGGELRIRRLKPTGID